MAYLVTRDDLRTVVDAPDFLERLFNVIQSALLADTGPALGSTAWIEFPQLPSARTFNVLPMSAEPHGTFVRVWADTVEDEVLLCLAPLTGNVQTVVAAGDIDRWRTSAPVALACKYLAPPSARHVAILGSGTEARLHLAAIRAALPQLESAAVYSPTAAHRQAYADTMSAATGLRVEAVSSPRAAVHGADIVCVAAWSPTPLVEADWLKPGTLVTVIAPSVADDVGDRLVVPALDGPAMRPCGWSPQWDGRANQGRTPAQPACRLGRRLLPLETRRSVSAARAAATGAHPGSRQRPPDAEPGRARRRHHRARFTTRRPRSGRD